jgi:hypothetical protein
MYVRVRVSIHYCIMSSRRGDRIRRLSVLSAIYVCLCMSLCVCVCVCVCVCNPDAVAIVFRQTFGDGRARAARTSAITFQLASAGGVCDPRTKYILLLSYYIVHS